MKTKSLLISVLSLAALAPTLAEAHPGHGFGMGFGAGAVHPLTGFDHLLAMLAVGMWAMQLGGRARWAAPLCFVTVMLVGAGMGMRGVPIGAVEQMLTASVLVFGLLIAVAMRTSLLTTLTLVSTFALFHGYAHGIEMNASSTAAAYMAGFAVSTLALHAAGYALMYRLSLTTPRAARISGVLIAVSGMLLCLGVTP